MGEMMVMGAPRYCRICGSYHAARFCGEPLPLQQAQMYIEALEKIAADSLLSARQREKIKGYFVSIRKWTGVPESVIYNYSVKTVYSPDLDRIRYFLRCVRMFFVNAKMTEKQFKNFEKVFENAKQFLLNPPVEVKQD